MSACHLSYPEHYQIQLGQSEGLHVSQIAARLGRHVDTIRRALARFADGYDADEGYYAALERRANSARNHPTKSARSWQSVEDRLRQDQAPEQIVLARACAGSAPVSIQAIYNRIERDRLQGGTLYLHRRRQRRPRCRADGRQKSWAHTAQPIRERPEGAARRQRTGHIEVDTMAGKKRDKYRLLVAVDRCSGWFMAERVCGGAAPSTAAALKRLFAQHPYLNVRTITSDRGMEFADLPKQFPGRHYVCDAYRPGQRGLCENTIGLLRQYLPKYSSMDNVSHAEIAKAVARINNRPRKRLGGRTPKQVLSKRIRAAATRT